jgi:hypothetical protein
MHLVTRGHPAVTHDSFALSDELLAAFTAATGCTVTGRSRAATPAS